MDNAQMAAVFEDIAARLRQRKDNIFKIRAYEKVARSIRDLKTPVADLAAAGRLAEIAGAGEAITRKITEMVATGKLAYYERLKAEDAGVAR